MGEIEAALRTIVGIKNAVVEPINSVGGEQHLVAYLETVPEIKEPLFRKKETEEIVEEQCNRLKGLKIGMYDESMYYNLVEYAEERSLEIMLDTLQKIGILNSGTTITYDSIMQDSRVDTTQKSTVKLWIKDLLSSGFNKRKQQWICYEY